MAVCEYASDHDSGTLRWVYDAQNIPLCKVCDKCEKEKLARYDPMILKGYRQEDIDEPIEPQCSEADFLYDPPYYDF